MSTPDLKRLVQELRQNANGVAQDRILLCGIYNYLKTHANGGNDRFYAVLVKYTQPYHNALVSRFDHSQDYSISQSKRNLIRAWDAYECFNDFDENKNSTDIAKQIEKLKALYQLAEKGTFDLVLRPEELLSIKTMVMGYSNGEAVLDDSYAQQIKSDYHNVIDFISSLK